MKVRLDEDWSLLMREEWTRGEESSLMRDQAWFGQPYRLHERIELPSSRLLLHITSPSGIVIRYFDSLKALDFSLHRKIALTELTDVPWYVVHPRCCWTRFLSIDVYNGRFPPLISYENRLGYFGGCREWPNITPPTRTDAVKGRSDIRVSWVMRLYCLMFRRILINTCD